jgi:hypothetical protein
MAQEVKAPIRAMILVVKQHVPTLSRKNLFAD